MSEAFLGTCGWSYSEWEGLLYPEKKSKLKQYCSIFSTVEIDSTFYALPEPGTVLGWVKHTPSNFIFSAKAPQTITHKKLLDPTRGVEADLKQFAETMRPLVEAEKLACVLLQLPPFLRFNPQRLESFLSLLPEGLRFAVEFRHDSWLREETFRLLENRQVAYTIVDEPALPPVIHVTSDLAYIRWHGRGENPWFNYKYSEQELQEWVPKVREASGKAKKVLGYFNNHFHGYAPENCLQIMQMLGIAVPHHEAALRRLTLFRKHGKPSAEEQTLETWIGTGIMRGKDQLLLKLSSLETLTAARAIPDEDFSLREDSAERLAAYVGDTTVDIDLKAHSVIHRCPAWSSLISEKKFCPHIAKLFLSIDSERSRRILSLIEKTIGQWKFESRTAIEFPARQSNDSSSSQGPTRT
jgi:uncharacterized protein YecE (DUF72 family)